MSIHVIARAIARPEAQQKLQQALANNQAASRREPGCVHYDIAQSTTDGNEFVTIEEWRTAADVTTHMQTPHVAALLAAVPALVAAPPDIRSYKAIG